MGDQMPPERDPNEVMREIVRRELPCRLCQRRPIKWRGRNTLVCLHCAGEETAAANRRAAFSDRWITASLVGPKCLACESDRVDADGVEWWCCNCLLREVRQFRRAPR
jgi:hypothetical protein